MGAMVMRARLRLTARARILIDFSFEMWARRSAASAGTPRVSTDNASSTREASPRFPDTPCKPPVPGPFIDQTNDGLGIAETRSPRIGATPRFTLPAKAGLRPGETFALELDDIDFQARTLRVERAWSLGRVKATQTSEARAVDLTPSLTLALRRHVA